MLFEVTADDIRLLDDADLRKLIVRLCEQEVRAYGCSPAAVTAGGHQDAADGGIDVRVSLPAGTAITGYIPAAATGFQVKAQKMPRQEILDEVAPHGVLRHSIANLANQGGAYIIVSSQDSVTDTALTERENAIREAIEGNAAAGSLRIAFYDRTRVATWVNQHPGIVPWVREKAGRPTSGWHPFGDWSSSPAPVDAPYLLDDGVRLLGPSESAADGLTAGDGVNSIRRILEKPKGIVRLIGLSGVGKTRLAQALFDGRVGTNALPQADAVYTDISEHPDPVPLELVARLNQFRQRAILIVDNCNPGLHDKLAARISGHEGLLSLITVEYDINDDEPENTNVFKLDVASVALMEKILESKFPAISAPSLHVIAEFSGGNSRIAIALAATAKDGESLANLKHRDLFERLFHQNKEKDGGLLNAAKACSLLYSFDGETLTGKESELTVLAGLAGTTVDQLFAYVAELHRRQLVQKRGQWRAILPHAIAHRLARLALEDIPFDRVEDAIMHSGSERMIRSFSKRMGYLHDDEHAKKLVAQWFADGGFLEPIGNYNELGKACFTNIAPVDPETTLGFIERAAARLPWFFGDENHNRSMIVRVLRSIAYDPALFDRSIALLKKFAVDETDDRHDSSRDVFKSLFMLYLSGTHATPAQRAQVVRSLLASGTDADEELGLEALRTMLECGHFSSHYPFEFGARSRDYGLTPRTLGAVREWLREPLRVAEVIGLQGTPLSAEARKIVASRFADLCARGGMMAELVALTDKLLQQGPWPEGWIGVRTTIRRYKDSIPEVERRELDALSTKLQPSTLEDMVRSYALSKEWGTLDVLEAEEDDEQDYVKAHDRIVKVCFDLGEKLARDEGKLVSLLPDLFASDNQKMIAMGHGLARGTPSLDACWRFLVDRFLPLPESKRKTLLLGGFMEEATRRSPEETDAILDGVLADARMHPHFMWLQCMAGLNSKACKRLAGALDIETIPFSSFEQIAYGGAHRGLDDQSIAGLLRQIATKDGGVRIAIEIVGMRILHQGNNLPVSETLIAVCRDLLRPVSFDQAQRHHAELTLAGVIKAALTRPEDEEIARILCDRLREGVQNHRIQPWDFHDVMTALAKTFPRVVLDVLVDQVDDDRTPLPNMFRDVRDDRPAVLDVIPEDTVLAWVNEKPDKRYASLARAIKFADGTDEAVKNWSPLAVKLIDLAPDPLPVLNTFRARFEPGSFSGSLAGILAERLPLLERLQSHPRAAVAAWAKTAAPDYALTVEQARQWEAKVSRKRDERFEP